MKNLGVIKEENKTKKLVSRYFRQSKKKNVKRRGRRGGRRREEKRYGNYDFGMDFCTLVWKSRFLYGFYDVWKKLLVLILSNNMYTFPPV